MQYNNSFSLGLQYSYLFGNQSIDEKRYIYDIAIDSSTSGGMLISEFIDDNNNAYYIYKTK